MDTNTTQYDQVDPLELKQSSMLRFIAICLLQALLTLRVLPNPHDGSSVALARRRLST